MLILSGTMLSLTEFSIISQCKRIIKLDISENRLLSIPNTVSFG
jgi:hypothetical protein